MATFINPKTRDRLVRPDGTVYILRPITSGEWMEFLSNCEADAEGTVRFDQAKLFPLARCSLVGWEGVTDQSGAAVEFPDTGAIDGLPVADVAAISRRALELSRLGVVDRKNSERPPPSPAAG